MAVTKIQYMLFLSTQMDAGAISESNKLFVLVMTQETYYHAQPHMITVLILESHAAK